MWVMILSVCVGVIMKVLVIVLACTFLSGSCLAATLFEDSGLSISSEYHVYSEMNNSKYSETGYIQNHSLLQFDLFGVNSIISNCDSNGNCLVQKNDKNDSSDVKSIN